MVVLAVCFSVRSYYNVKAVFSTGFRLDKPLPALPLRPSLQLWRQQEGSKKPHIFRQQANQGHCLGEMPGKHLQSSFHSCQARSGGRSRALAGFCVIVSPLIKVKLRRQPLPQAFIRHLQFQEIFNGWQVQLHRPDHTLPQKPLYTQPQKSFC